MKSRTSLFCAIVAASALLPATAGLQIRSRPADVVSTVRSPVKVTTLANGHTLVDFGKDAAGYVQFDAKGAGSYEMIIGEALDSSGAVNNTAHAGMYNCWYSYVTDKNNKKVECSLRAVTLSGSVSAAGTFRVPMALPWQKRFDGNAHVKTAANDEVCPFRYIEVVSLPSGVSAADLRQVMYHYPFDYDDSSFTSSDANLNQVYDLCKWSLYADSYLGYWLDGDRERQFYQADAYVSILDSLGVFSDMTMNKRTAKEFFVDEWKHEWSVEWYLYTFLTAFQDYWHSGDISTLLAYYDHIKPTATTGKFYKIPSQYQLENGLLASPKDGWESSIIDWPQMYRYDYDMGKSGTNGSDNDDGRLMPIENALLCQQYRDLATTAAALGKTADAAQWSAMATKIYNAYQEVFFDASCGLYRDKAKTDGYRSTKHSIQANAAALAFGMVPADKIATVAEFVANEGMKCGTYMAHLVLEGLGRAGRTDAAIAYMASTAGNSWMNMINEGLTTCCETWSIASGNGVVGGTPDVNHPWSCAPASIISRYVLGVRPAAAGWAKATVAPQFGSLTQARGKVPTAKGSVEVEYANSQLTVTVPAGLAADITFAGQTKTVAANAATRTVTISEGGFTPTDGAWMYSQRDWSDAIVCWGDSLTRGNGASTVTAATAPTNYMPGLLSGGSFEKGYPMILAERLSESGHPVFGIADDGCGTARILASTWSGELAVANALTLPTSGAVDGTPLDASTKQKPLYPWISPTLSNSSSSRYATPGLSGSFVVDGQVVARARWYGGNASRFASLGGADDAVAIPAGTRFETDVARMFKRSINVIFAGCNDKSSGVSSCLPLIKKTVDAIDGGRYVVVSPHVYAGESTTASTTGWLANAKARAAEFETAFDVHHLNLVDLLERKGLSTAVELGVMTATEAAATTWYAQGTGLIADGVHFNDKGYAVVAKLLEEKLVALGYVDGNDPEPIEKPWSGKKVSILGDSYSSYQGSAGSSNCYYYPEDYGTLPKAEYIKIPQSGMWWDQVIAHFGGELAVNSSVGGSPMTACYTAQNFYQRVSAKTNLLGSPDVIFVFGGMNDHWMPGNTLSEEGKFAAGIQTLFDYLEANYASARVYVILNKEHTGTSWTQWGITAMQRTVLTDQAKSHGFTTVDLQGYFSTENADLNQASYPHPTAQGQAKIASRVISEIENGGDEPPVKTATLPTAKTGLKYTGGVQTGVPSGTGYTIAGNTGTDAKSYTATVVLADGYQWADGSEAKTRTISWSIAKGANSWKTKPSVSPATWVEDCVPATIAFSNGANTFGASVTCDTDEAALKALVGGESKTVTFTAAGCANYDEITHAVTVKVLATGGDPEEPTGDEWGFEHQYTVAGVTYNVLTFTNTEKTVAWTLPTSVTKIDYLVVGGGGAGGTINDPKWAMNGGDGGGVTNGRLVVEGGASLAVTVGAGGARSATPGAGASGSLSELKVGAEPFVALGGAGGERSNAWASPPTAGFNYGGTGGKGAGTAAAQPNSFSGTAGGKGKGSNITGEEKFYGAGGGGGSVGYDRLSGGAGGETGGGAGGQAFNSVASSQGSDGTFYGAGGGGSAGVSTGSGGSGHQGVVIVRYVVSGTEPIDDEGWGRFYEQEDGDKTYMVIEVSATSKAVTWTLPSNVTKIDYLVVGGGASGGSSNNGYSGGGGGAGGVVEGSLAVAGGAEVTAVVGAGGASVKGSAGEDGKASTLTVGGAVIATALPGAGGGGGASNGRGGSAYACGGGAGGGYQSQGTKTGGAGTVSKGGDAEPSKGAGGGGAGGDGTAGASGGAGGAGVTVTIFDGENYDIAGGGCGSSYGNKGKTTAFGGGATATDAARWGAGGGGAGGTGVSSGAGYQGVVVIRYELGEGGDEPPVSHEHTPVEIPAIPASCTNEGWTAGTKCGGCGETLTAPTAIPMLDHAYGDDGICAVCGAKDPTHVDPEPPVGPDEPVVTGEDWGYSNSVTIAGADYMIVVFTNTAETLGWEVPQGVAKIDYLVVGGGGAGGSSGNNNGGGGGGAGGVLQATGVAVTGGEQVKVSVGAGGQGVASGVVQGASGTGSSLTIGGTVVSVLPGAGGSKGAFNGSGSADVCACGGGGGGGTAGQGDKAGGAGAVSKGGIGYNGAGGGGGGAGGDGVDSADGGTGGAGVATTIFDGTERRIAGGGSGAPGGRGGNPSVDGGGAGGYRHVSYGGADATGGTTWGAGGGGGKNASPSGSGHQGVVVIRYALGDEPVVTGGSTELTCSNYRGVETLANFPMLVRISPTAIPKFSYDGLSADLIAFKDASGNELPYDVDTWNPSGESLVWVKVPSLAKTTKITFAWGKASGVTANDTWTDYAGVWHFNEGTSGTYASSGAAENDANAVNGATATASGAAKVGGGVTFTRGANKANTLQANNVSLAAGGPVTLSGWWQLREVRRAATDTYPKLFTIGGYSDGGYYLQCGDNGTGTKLTSDIVTARSVVSEDALGDSMEILGGGLHHLVVTIRPGQTQVWIDGDKKVDSSAVNCAFNGKQFALIGEVGSATVDEIRLRNSAVTEDWIAADYQQQVSADGVLYAVGGEPQPEEPPTVNPEKGEAEVTVKAADADAAEAAALAAIVATEGVDRDAYAACFKAASAEPLGDGKWKVTLVLDPAAVTPVVEDEEGKAAFAVVGNGVSVHITNAKRGLWYALEYADALGAGADWTVDAATWTQGADLAATKGDGPARFYRVVVRAAAP